ncbi:MAG: 4-alpha-glucanotransferase [Planctomycetaceae bacterium]|nr:4-alpha-glucanotransferase [Planctomycetaceae bacterium]
MQLPRACGLLCHVTSLPSRYGIGDLGPAAYDFVDFLVKSGQRLWQTLPLGPPACENSPYSAYSAFAGNPLLISPDFLLHSALISADDLLPLRETNGNPHAVDYNALIPRKSDLLRKAWSGFRQQLSGLPSEAFVAFCRTHAYWLDDFARFEALTKHFGFSDWTQWPADVKARDPVALAAWDQTLQEEIQYVKFLQFVFDQQWSSLKKYANQRGVQIYGDMPIFVAHQSADVWANRRLFDLDEAGQPRVVAGVPPDCFSEDGQRWGNPLYDWNAMRADGYRWWIQRLRHSFLIFDLLRIDHFRGFEAYWEIPAEQKTAIVGRWVKGPGQALFDALREQLGDLPLIAEDLGLITPEVNALLESTQLPGMRVLQFGFGTEADDFHRPTKFPIHSVGYTGTHDNDTLLGWYRGYVADPKQVDVVTPYLRMFLDQHPNVAHRPLHWQLIAAVLHSVANSAVVPVQDILGLGSEARMNVPGEAKGNWGWRLHEGQLTSDISRQLFDLVIESGRG